MTNVDKAPDLLRFLKKHTQAQIPKGLAIVKADSETTLIFEGSVNPVSIKLFVVPEDFLPLVPLAMYFALPISGTSRWGIIQLIKLPEV